MSAGTLVIIVSVLIALGALIVARAGIRAIQSARAMVFYRTRQARMRLGWQRLILDGFG